jgi:DNA-binding CsgD family transcriptional regulator
MSLPAARVEVMGDLSEALGACRSPAALEQVSLEWLADHVPTATVTLTDIPAPSRIRVVLGPRDGGHRLPYVQRLIDDHLSSADRTDHPLLLHYFHHLQPMTPLRLSDLMSDRAFTRTRTYTDVLRPLGIRRQVALVCRRAAPGGSAGYALSREKRDFTDEELALLQCLQPVLYSVHQAMARHPRADLTAAERRRLTPAEAGVLELLATGLSAVSIGHVRRTSRRTVEKQIESIYAKLGSRNRIHALQCARREQIIEG